jgi:hypothetical protein
MLEAIIQHEDLGSEIRDCPFARSYPIRVRNYRRNSQQVVG